jgi:hypothetical protein
LFTAAAFMAAFGLHAQTPPPQSPPAALQSPAPSKLHHVRHHRRHHTAPPSSITATTRPPAAEPDDHGFKPAPVPAPSPASGPDPRAELLPPESKVPNHAEVTPGTMQLHYPFSGNGYVTGSSPQAMDDATTAKIPGVVVKMPLQPATPQPLPPP